MTDKQKAISEMATIINKTNCSSETFLYLMNALTEKQSFNGIDTQMFIDRKKAEALANAGYGNIKQTLTEFAEKVKYKAIMRQEKIYVNGEQYSVRDYIGNIINETLNEFLNSLNNKNQGDN